MCCSRRNPKTEMRRNHPQTVSGGHFHYSAARINQLIRSVSVQRHVRTRWVVAVERRYGNPASRVILGGDSLMTHKRHIMSMAERGASFQRIVDLSTIRARFTAGDYNDVCSAYGMAPGTGAVRDLRSTFAAVEMLIHDGAGVIFTQPAYTGRADRQFDTHEDDSGEVARRIMAPITPCFDNVPESNAGPAWEKCSDFTGRGIQPYRAEVRPRTGRNGQCDWQVRQDRHRRSAEFGWLPCPTSPRTRRPLGLHVRGAASGSVIVRHKPEPGADSVGLSHLALSCCS